MWKNTYVHICKRIKKKVPLEIHFIYLGNEVIYHVFMILHNLSFIFDKILFIL